MKKTMILLGCVLICTVFLHSQVGKLEIEGPIQLGNTSDPAPEAGTMRWSGSDFLGWNGSHWVSLTTGTTFFGEVSDFDGNIYQTIMIDTREWMAQNLRTTHYNNGDAILRAEVDQDWEGTLAGAWCWYDNSPSFDQPYGKLYNWSAVKSPSGLCPSGWEVPSGAELSELIDLFDPALVDHNAIGVQSTVAATSLKEKGPAHWFSPNTPTTNESGFTAVGGGLRNFDGAFGGLNEVALFWSSSMAVQGSAWYRGMSYFSGNVTRHFTRPESGMSVRCIKIRVPLRIAEE